MRDSSISYDGQYTIAFQGDILFSTISELLKSWVEIQEKIHNLSKIQLSCSNLHHVDSAFMALLIEIKRFCNTQGIRLSINGLSQNKINFLQAYGVMEIIND